MLQVRFASLNTFVLCCGLLVMPHRAAAQAPPATTAPQKRAQATRIERGRITIDGQLSEGEWQSTPVADHFVQQQPAEGAPVSDAHRSEIRFLYDEEHLYIGARFHEDEPSRLVVNELKRDFNARAGDLFVVVLDTFLDKLNAYNFQTNPGCAIRDSQSYDDGRTINANWDGAWTCRSTIDEHGWTVEEAIPFKQLRFPRSELQVWGLQVFRLIRHSNEQTVWNPVPRQFNQFKTSYAGVLEGIRGVTPGRNIRLKPFAIGEARHLQQVDSTRFDGGLDAKIGIGTNLVLDATVRTDFSQVETDAQQINLTRFSLFFPEKREFFLENQGAFQIGPPASSSSNLVPFFSRTIGLSDTGTPIPVVGGGRLTGKVGRTSVAMLNMQTEQEVRTGGLAPLPAANVTVLRLGREFFRNSSAGVFYLGKERGAGYNRLFGADTRLNPTREWQVDGMIMRSEKNGIGEGLAWRAGTQVDRGLTQYTLSYTSLGDTFRDELGFVPRQGVDILTTNLMRRVRPTRMARRIREIRPQLPMSRFTRGRINPATGRPIGVETALISPTVQVEMADASVAEFAATWDEELLVAAFRPQGIAPGQSIAPGRYQFINYVASYDAQVARRFAPGFQFRGGEFYNGSRTGFSLGGRMRLSEKLATSLTYSRDVVTLPATRFTTGLAVARIDASFSTRMFLSAFIQYNSVTRQLASNIRYHFIHRPLSDLFLVYNDTHFIDISRPTAQQLPARALTLKYTHLFSF
jgi:hypothetical protein